MARKNPRGHPQYHHGAEHRLRSHHRFRSRSGHPGKHGYLPGRFPASHGLHGKKPDNWRDAIYYCFYENPGEHNAPRHDGIRTDRYTLSYIWTSDEWMLFDMKKDPMQMKNVIDDPAYKSTVEQLKKRYNELRKAYKVPENCPGGKGTAHSQI